MKMEVTDMASKAPTAETKNRKPAAPKPASVEAPAAAVETPAAEAPALVTKIVSVETPSLTQGVETMTETAKAKATDFFADVKTKATEAAEKGKKFAAESVEYNKANIEAMVEAGKIAAKGAQELGQTNLEYAKKNFEEAQAAVKELTAVKTPTDFVKLQGEMVRKSFDTAVAQGSKNVEASVKLFSDIFQPISNRIAVTTDLFKKAA